MTRFLFSFSFLLLSLVMGVRAQTIADFKYELDPSSKQITIKSGKTSLGEYESIRIPSSVELSDGLYTVTIISGLLSSSNNETVDVFIPSTVTTFADRIILPNDWKKLKSIVIENGDFKISKNSPFTVSDFNSNNLLDNIIVLSSCSKTPTELTEKSNASAYIFKTGEIKIELLDLSVLTVQMYLFGQDSKIRLKFGNERLFYLLSALQRHGIDLNDIESIDLSQMSQDGKTINFDNLTDFSAIPNAQVITHKTTINDMAENYTPQAFTGLISYSRSNTAGWNTVCLPFDVKESDFPAGTEIYQMSSDTEDAIYLSRIEEGTKLLAGTPCFIWSPDEIDTWNLSIQGSIAANIPAGTSSLEHWTLIGSFNKKPLGAGYYKLNSAGDAFVKTVAGTSHVYPFRCYIAPTPNNSSAPARLGMGIDEEATITLVPDDRAPQQVKLYDLMGRPRQGNAAGLFVPAKR